jgi:hypothetical protein
MELENNYNDRKFGCGCLEVVSTIVTAPSDGLIGFQLKTAGGERVAIRMTCKKARAFCDMLHDSLLYHEEFGEQYAYNYVDRYVPGYDPKDCMVMQSQRNQSHHLLKSDGMPNVDVS